MKVRDLVLVLCKRGYKVSFTDKFITLEDRKTGQEVSHDLIHGELSVAQVLEQAIKSSKGERNEYI